MNPDGSQMSRHLLSVTWLVMFLLPLVLLLMLLLLLQWHGWRQPFNDNACYFS